MVFHIIGKHFTFPWSRSHEGPDGSSAGPPAAAWSVLRPRLERQADQTAGMGWVPALAGGPGYLLLWVRDVSHTSLEWREH